MTSLQAFLRLAWLVPPILWWLFYDLLDVRPGDQLDDLYPGSGGVGRAFAMLEQAALPRVAVARRSAVAA